MQSIVRSFLKPCEIEMLIGHIIVANRFHEFEGARVCDGVAGTQRTEGFAYLPVRVASGYRHEHARRMVAERGRKTCLLLCREKGGGKIRSTEPPDHFRPDHLHNHPPLPLFP